MKKILCRGGMSPFESFSASEVILKNSIGTNVGNFLYLYGVLRNIVREDTVVKPTYYKRNFSGLSIEKMNLTMDCFLIPLADAFRPDFVPELKACTNLVKKLKIPCIVTGVGVKTPIEESFDHSFSFDEDVKEFVRAVLEKSAKIGVRGERTGAYLRHLGFREETDYTVIGCPSLFIHGPALRIREPEITPESFVCYNMSHTTPDNMLRFVKRSKGEFASAQFVPQTISELKLLYTGQPFHVSGKPLFPTKITEDEYQSDQTRFFLNVPTWVDCMKTADFSFGTRLHGNVASMLAGTPSILFHKDSRVSELAEYHNMTRFPAKNVDDSTNIWDLIETADFHSAEKDHYARYSHFIDFLEENGLDPIRQEPDATEEVPFEKRMREVKLEEPVTSIARCSSEEATRRIMSYYPGREHQVCRAREEERMLFEKNCRLKKKLGMGNGKEAELSALKEEPEERPVEDCTPEEMAGRIETYYPELDRRLARMKKETQSLRVENSRLKAQMGIVYRGCDTVWMLLKYIRWRFFLRKDKKD
ncbi:MAG: polysaccharide pyruvyl transferase family protein [Clostridiales bacterium]|nr:polysaccharide pyruvyl transferase family protein [Clostridiales bacterium]